MHSSASMLQYPNVIPADRMVLCPGMFGYARLVRETFDVRVLVLLQTCSKPACSLAEVKAQSTTQWQGNHSKAVQQTQTFGFPAP